MMRLLACRLLPVVLLLLASPAWAQPQSRTIETVVPQKYEVVTKYPAFGERTPLADYAETRIGNWARKQHDAFVKTARGDLAAEGGSMPNGVPYAQEIQSKVTFYNPNRLISVRIDGYEYTGGAHPSPFVQVFNFARVNGAVRTVTLRDMFRPGSRYKKRVAERVIAKLRAKGASSAQGMTRLSREQQNRFVVVPDGLLFLFPPYDVASYAEGQFEVKLTAKELGLDFNRALLAR